MLQRVRTVVCKENFARLLYCEGVVKLHYTYTHERLVGLWAYYLWTLDGVIFQHVGALFTHKAVALCTHYYTLLGIHSWEVCITSKSYTDIKCFTKLHTQAHKLLHRSTFPIPSQRLTTNLQTFLPCMYMYSTCTCILCIICIFRVMS